MDNQAPWWMLPLLALVVLGIFAGGMVAAFAWGDTTMKTTVVTASITLATAAVGYFFGSSAGSTKKDETLSKIASAPPPTNGAPQP